MKERISALLVALSIPILSISKKPHIVFILVDDMGYNDFYTSSDLSGAWPSVAALAKSECVKVEHYYTQPICTPTRGAFMSGRMPIRLGLQHGVIAGNQDYGLPLDETTLADKLAAAGYNTIGIGKWHLGVYNNASTPYRRGFNHFYGYMMGDEDYLTHQYQGYLDLNEDGVVDRGQTNVYSPELFSAKAIKWIQEHKSKTPEKPLFFYFPLQNVHSPLEAPAVYTSSAACSKVPNKDRKTFCGMAKAADSAIGNVTRALDAAFPGEDLVLIIGGDNGGATMAAGNNCPDYGTPSCMRGMKGDLWEGGVRNNALLCSKTLLPDALKGATYSKGLVHITDWHATIRDLAGAKDDTKKPLDGIGMWDTITKNIESPRKEFLLNIDPCPGFGSTTCRGSEAAYRFQGCVHDACGDWKLLVNVSSDDWYPVPSSVVDLPSDGLDVSQMFPPSSPPADWLFNISADANETNNLVAKYPHVVAFLKDKIAALAKEAVTPCNLPNGTCSENDPDGVAAVKAHNAIVPWAADPSPDVSLWV